MTVPDTGHTPRGSGRWVCTGPATLVWSHAGDRRLFAAQLVGSNHEPSHCLGGMWLHPRRMFCLLAEHGLLQVVAADRDLADRVRAAGRGREDLPRPDLSHTLRT